MDSLRRKIVSEETVNKTTRMSTSTADSEEEDLVPEEVETDLIQGKTVLVAIVSRTTETSTSTIRSSENETHTLKIHTDSYQKEKLIIHICLNCFFKSCYKIH